jgi:hypothetical protein
MSDGSYLLNDLNFDYNALAASRMGVGAMDSGRSGSFGDGGSVFNSYSSFSINSNLLWLQITNISDGTGYANLYNATDQVYAIWSTTNLALPFNVRQVETELQNPNTNCQPFTVSQLGRQNLFLEAQDWTGVTANGNTTPLWWLWYFYGNAGLALSDTSLDSSGNPLLTDYQNYTNGVTPCDPNVISFTLSATNLYVSAATVPLAISLQGGIPYCVAMLVNDTNYADAVWQPYTGTNLTVTLGATDGVYNVWVGLEGLPAGATVTWDTDDIDFTLDRLAPTVSITSPALASGGATVIKPYLQLQGSATKPLASLSYNISNALGMVSSIAGQVTDVAGYDPVYCKYMTNYFQCYDVPLTTNDNFITLRVTDQAGNTTTTNFDVVLDYTGATNPPVVNLIWPQDGMAVSGTNITIRGTMSDETGSIQAQIVDGGGNTNLIAGLVERNGMFWIENVPLNGTSQISIQAVDAAGNMATDNFTTMPSALTLTINSTPTGDDLYRPSGTVSGTVGDPDAVVTVNGMTATVDDSFANADGTYNWSADGVPIYGMGTATFDATAAAASGSGADLTRTRAASSSSSTANASLAVEMGPILKVTHYNFSEVDQQVEYRDGRPPYINLQTHTMSYDGHFAPDANGQWQQTYQASDTAISNQGGDCGTNAQSWANPESFDPDGFVGADVDVDADTYNFSVTHSFAKTAHHHWDYYNPVDGLVGCADATVGADTHWTLYTGGKAGINLQNLFAISAWANSYQGSPTGPGDAGLLFWFETPIIGVPEPGLQVIGLPLGNDYTWWSVQPENAAVDLGLTVLGKNDAGAGGSQAKYHSYFEVFVNQPMPGTQKTYSDTSGHAFYRFYSSAPDAYLKSIHPELLPYENNNWGFYPHGALCGLPGILANDNTHGKNVARNFYIGFPDFIAGLAFTRGLSNAPPTYCLAIDGYPCVGAARQAGQTAGVTLPSDWFPQNFGADILLQFPGPPNDYTPRYAH